jgi:DNA-binding LacI/PurR family transcriptional regulator
MEAQDMFDRQKEETLKQIEEAAKQRNTEMVYAYSRIMMDLEEEYARNMLTRSVEKSKYQSVDFSVS